MAASAAAAEAAAITRRLASCNAAARERAVRHLLAEFLPSSAPDLSAADLLKLWKGLFFCFWHADKPPYQSDLATRLAAAVSSAPTPAAAAAFLAAYLATISREWAHIDVHRLDKFYLLNRRFLAHAFLFLAARASFAPDATAQIVSVLSDRALLPEPSSTATSRGLGYHVADAFLDELIPVLPITLQSMSQLLDPFFAVLERSTDRVLVGKVRSSVFERFLESGSRLLEVLKKGEEEVEKGSVEEKLGKVGLLFGFSKRFLDIGAKAETVQGNRKALFGLRDAFVKLEKGLELSGITISAPVFEGTKVLPTEAVVEHDMDLDEAKVEKKRKKKKAKMAALVVEEGEEAAKVTKKEKKVKKDKKEKKEKKSKKKNKAEVAEDGSEQSVHASAEDQQMGDDTDDTVTFDEVLMSNLQRQFEKAAEEAGMPVTPATMKVAKKRKRSKSADRSSEAAGEVNVLAQDGDKSGKRVRFSMKNNLVWKPQTPLPPQCLRLPPSATPRGSALKSGVQPGPIRESSTTPVKKTKPRVKSAKKMLKKTPSSAVKRLRKLQSFSA